MMKNILLLLIIVCFHLPNRAQKPNVIFILTGQWRPDAFGYAGNKTVKTPDIDSFSSEAIIFRNAVSVCPVGTPYRASLMTGRYPTSTGMFLNDLYLPENELCMAEIDKSAGYRTAYYGKWHLNGHSRMNNVQPYRRQGFDYRKALECSHDYINMTCYENNDPEILKFEPFVWPSEIPVDCPFKSSGEFNAVRFLGLKSGYRYGDTWYPTWASNDTLYSPWTDGVTKRSDGYNDRSNSGAGPDYNQSGQGVIAGADPMTLKAYSTGIISARSNPYRGRYPCGSLVYEGVWYYGTYCLGPDGSTQYGDIKVNWPWLGPFVGFHVSTDYGHTWIQCPHKPDNPIFGETGINGYPVKIGSPHFVDFGKNMQYSPDGKAYLVAHGADTSDTQWRFWNDSWITGDQIYLLRVTPSPENINDISKYEFYGGRDSKGLPVWTRDFKAIKPLLEWNNHMGCVTITYNAPLKKYIMCVTDGGNTVSKMHTYILESDKLEGEWKIMAYLKDFGEQGYFVNIPSKFISPDGKQMWLLYSGNFAPDWNGQKIVENPPGSHYGMVFQKIELVRKQN